MSDPKGLGWNKEENPSLYKLYAKKLLEEGWAGWKNAQELKYTEEELARRVKLAKKKNPVSGA